MYNLVLLGQGLRYVLASAKRKIKGSKEYSGNAKTICESIVKDCWNGKYFLNSLGNYREFWTRDFGFSVEALLKLGYRKEVLKTLEYALDKFSAHGSITTTITPSGKPVSFPNVPSPDSVALLFHALKLAKAKKLIEKHKTFLENEIANIAVLLDSGLVKNIQLSGMRDYAIRKSSCYDNTMVAFLANTVRGMKLANPLTKHNGKKILMDNFWTGTQFNDDIEQKAFTGDANLLPFWTGVIKDKKMFRKVLGKMESLAKPFPLKYTARASHKKMRLPEIFVPNWEHDSIWSNLGMLYVDTISKTKQGKIVAQYAKIVERDRNMFELFTPEGKPYRSWAYLADEGMLWSAILAARL